MWLEYIGFNGVVVRRYIDFLIILLIPTPLVLALFFAAASLLLCSLLKCFFVLAYVIFVQFTLLKEHSRSFKNRDHVDMAI